VLANRTVLATGTLGDMNNVDDPWVKEYFLGPRARAAVASARPALVEKGEG
jgi:phospholipid/cholesterol/gamma-HCH transport system ATP-binding protein